MEDFILFINRENKEQFNTWKKQVEDIEIKEPIDCLRIIELNLSNICNLRCPFCPQSKGWKNNKVDFMDVETAQLIAEQLKSFNFKGYICTAGFGEPSLNPNWKEILHLFSDFNIVVVSNGQAPQEDWEDITNIAQIKISVHDWNNIEKYKEKFKNTNAWFRNHDVIKPKMNIYNRGGFLWEPKEVTSRVCNLPFYKIFIDCDGSYLSCEADWNRKSGDEKFNIRDIPIEKFFTETLMGRRILMLGKAGRQNLPACQYCDIQGDLTGKKFKKYWEERINNGEY